MDQAVARVAFIKARLDEAATTAQAILDDPERNYTFWEDERRDNAEWTWRDVAAKRELLDELAPLLQQLDDIAYSEGRGAMGHGEPVAYLVELLARPYADHEDYSALFAVGRPVDPHVPSSRTPTRMNVRTAG